MPGAYPVELRERVITAYDDGEGTYEEIAERFKVGRATVDRWLGLVRRTGSLEPKAMGGARHERKVQGEAEDYIRELLEQMPDSTQTELADAYEECSRRRYTGRRSVGAWPGWASREKGGTEAHEGGQRGGRA